MIVEITSKIESVSKEVVDIHIEFDPMNHSEERLAAIITAMTDLIKNYDRLNTLSD